MSAPQTGWSIKTAALIFTLVVLCAALGHFWWQSQRPAPTAGQSPGSPLLPEPKPLTPFQLTSHDGAPFTLERLRGQWSFFFFGYTHCPDVCPTAMGDLALLFEQLKQRQPEVLANTRGYFISVDPKRDTLELLAGYVPYFNPTFVGATGGEEEVKALSRQMGVGYLVQQVQGPDSYEISHTSSMFLVDPQARLTAVFGRPHKADEIAAHFIDIRKRYGEKP